MNSIYLRDGNIHNFLCYIVYRFSPFSIAYGILRSDFLKSESEIVPNIGCADVDVLFGCSVSENPFELSHEHIGAACKFLSVELNKIHFRKL
jgi:hypothetical protein